MFQALKVVDVLAIGDVILGARDASCPERLSQLSSNKSNRKTIDLMLTSIYSKSS